MQIYCRQCGKEIQADDINLDTMIAKCSACNAVFSFADMYESEHSHKKKKQLTYDMPMPDGFTVHDNGANLTIERKWFNFTYIFLAVFSVIWNGMIWFVFVPNFSQVGGIFSLFLLPFIAAGLFLIYTAIAGFLNTTTITVDNSSLNIRHRPIPFPGKNVASGDIEQLFTKEKIHRGKNSTTETYQLRVLLSNGREQNLLQDLAEPEQAMFVEQEVERFLGIENIRVQGEYRS